MQARLDALAILDTGMVCSPQLEVVATAASGPALFLSGTVELYRSRQCRLDMRRPFVCSQRRVPRLQGSTIMEAQLHWAIHHLSIVSILLNHQVEENAQSNVGQTVLLCCVEDGDLFLEHEFGIDLAENRIAPLQELRKSWINCAKQKQIWMCKRLDRRLCKTMMHTTQVQTVKAPMSMEAKLRGTCGRMWTVQVSLAALMVAQ